MKAVTKYFHFELCLSKTKNAFKRNANKKSVLYKNQNGFFINSIQLSHKQSVLMIIE